MLGLSRCSGLKFMCLGRRLFTNFQSPNGLGGSFSGFTLFISKAVGGAQMTVR